MADTTTASKPTPDEPSPKGKPTADPLAVQRTLKWAMKQRRVHLFALRGLARRHQQLQAMEMEQWKCLKVLDMRIGREVHAYPAAAMAIGFRPLADDGSFYRYGHDWESDDEDDSDSSS